MYPAQAHIGWYPASQNIMKNSHYLVLEVFLIRDFWNTPKPQITEAAAILEVFDLKL